MSELSELAKECLLEAGWMSNRRLDARAIEGTYRQRGYRPGLPAIKFMQEFGGLSLSFQTSRGTADDCEFILEKAVAGEPRWLTDYARVLGMPVTPIGSAHRKHCDLLMTNDGRVFEVSEDLIVLLGGDGHDAINALCEGRHLEQIAFVPEPDIRSAIEAHLTSQTLECLRRAGWHSRREIDINPVDDVARASGLSLPELVQSFLCEFDRLHLYYPSTHPIWPNSVCILDGVAAIRQFPLWCLKESSMIAGEELVPIGLTSNEAVTLLMSGSGALYGGMKEVAEMIKLIGRSPAEGLNALCEGRMWHEIL